MREVNFELFDNLSFYRMADIEPHMCYTCGAIVPRPWLQNHADWHDSLGK